MTAVDTVPCPECGRPFGEHTIVEYREHTATHLPFESVEAPTLNDLSPGQVFVDHLDVAAVVLRVDTALAGPLHLPGVEFRFWSSDGTRPAPVVFIADDERLFRELGRLIVSACGAAPMRAKRADRQQRRMDGDR